MKNRIATLVVGILLGGALMSAVPATARWAPVDPQTIKQRVRALEQITANFDGNRFTCPRGTVFIVLDDGFSCDMLSEPTN